MPKKESDIFHIVDRAITRASDVFLVSRGYNYDKEHILIYSRDDTGLLLTFEVSSMKLLSFKILTSEQVAKIFCNRQCKTVSLSGLYELDWGILRAMVSGEKLQYGGLMMG